MNYNCIHIIMLTWCSDIHLKFTNMLIMRYQNISSVGYRWKSMFTSTVAWKGFYITLYPILRITQTALHPLANLFSRTLLTSVGRIQPCCNKCTNTIATQLSTTEWTGAIWRDWTCAMVNVQNGSTLRQGSLDWIAYYLLTALFICFRLQSEVISTVVSMSETGVKMIFGGGDDVSLTYPLGTHVNNGQWHYVSLSLDGDKATLNVDGVSGDMASYTPVDHPVL